MTLKEALLYGYERLGSQVPNPILDTQVLLSFVLQKDKVFALTYPDLEISKTEEKKFKKYLELRANLKPIAQITNQKEFFGLNFYINDHVLIPRPETELLVEEAKTFAISNLKIRTIDIGTGSGAIAISLAKALNIEIDATDISKEALVVAKKNAIQHSVGNKVHFYQANLFPKNNKVYNLIVANLPYVPESDLGKDREVAYEPKIAIFSGNNGTAINKKLIDLLPEKLGFPGLALIELDPRNSEELLFYAQKKLMGECQTDLIFDLAKKPRFLKILKIK